jgi:hypothetical protein
LRNFTKIAQDRSAVAHAIVNIGKAKAVNFGYVKVILKISKAAVERGDLYTMPTLLEVPDDFAGAGGVSGPLTVYAVEDVCHRIV